MSMDYILRRFSQDTGVNGFATSTTTADDQQYCIDLLNESSKDFWFSRDLTNSLGEVIIVCLDNHQLSLPSFIAEPRALRELDSFIPWRLSDIRPRYYKNSWADDSIRNWRVKSDSCIARDVTNTAPPNIIVPFVESPNIQVTITGSTQDARQITETQIIVNTITPFTNSFVDYQVIKKDRANLCDVLIQDADGLDLSIIFNNEKEANFKIIDAGQYFSNPQPFPVEVLFKPRYIPFVNLTDEFQLRGYDDALIQKMIALYEMRRKNVPASQAAEALAETKITNTAGDKQKGIDHRVEFQQDGHTSVFLGLKGFNTLR